MLAQKLASLLPFIPAFAGLGLSAWRFGLHDQVGGLAFGLGGMLLMVVMAIRLSDPREG